MDYELPLKDSKFFGVCSVHFSQRKNQTYQDLGPNYSHIITALKYRKKRIRPIKLPPDIPAKLTPVSKQKLVPLLPIKNTEQKKQIKQDISPDSTKLRLKTPVQLYSTKKTSSSFFPISLLDYKFYGTLFAIFLFNDKTFNLQIINKALQCRTNYQSAINFCCMDANAWFVVLKIKCILIFTFKTYFR